MNMQQRLCSVLVVVALGLLSLATESHASFDDIVMNAGFERGEAAWEMWGEGDLRDEYHGMEANEGGTFLRLWSRSGWYQNFVIVPGNKYQVSAYVATAEKDAFWGDAFGEVKVEWRNRDHDDDIEVGEPISLKFDAGKEAGRKISKDRWTRVSLPLAEAPEGATHGRVLFTIWTEGGDVGGGCALFDNLQVSRVPGP